MRDDQIKRLAEVSERLAEVVIADADPDNWTANGMLLSEMTSKDRGDAAWCRKTAVQSVALLIRVEQLLLPKDGQPPRDDYPDPENEIKRAEKSARDMLERVGQSGRNESAGR